VIEGAARFTVAGDAFDAPARTVVFVPDPAARRGAVATAANTTALVVGGSPERPYDVSPWEWVAEAIPAWRNGDYGTARRTIEEGLAHHPDNAGLLYDLACADALDGDRDAALAHLRRAIELDPHYAPAAHEEDDFVSIRGEPGFPP